MLIPLSPEIEIAVEEQAKRRGTSPEEFVRETLRRRLPPESPPNEDWETLLMNVGSPAGVSLPDEATQSDALYE